MTIKIIPQEEIEQQASNSVIGKIPLIFYPSPQLIYSRRKERLLELAKTSPFADYLHFCAEIAAQQALLVKTDPITQALHEVVSRASDQSIEPLNIDNYPLTVDWQGYLVPIINAVKTINQDIAATGQRLLSLNKEQLQKQAHSLLTGHFELIDSNEALFLWAALSLYFCQLASQLPGKSIAELGGHQTYCPICHAAPSASVIHLSTHQGLRYLHCSLCESEWYMPRIHCTNCGESEQLFYYSLDDELSAIKTECCDHCHSYLKLFNQDRDPHLDVIADDINSLMLDMKTEDEGFAKSGINAFLFTTESDDLN